MTKVLVISNCFNSLLFNAFKILYIEKWQVNKLSICATVVEMFLFNALQSNDYKSFNIAFSTKRKYII